MVDREGVHDERGEQAVGIAAGTGPGCGVARKDTVDRGASVLVAEAAGVPFLQVSTMGLDRADDPGTGAVTRDDVAAVLVAPLDQPPTAGRTLELVDGETPIDRAVS